MSNVLERVRHLVALAARSESVEEARTSALTACRLIAEHGLQIAEAVAEEVANEVGVGFRPEDYVPRRRERARPAIDREKLGRAVSRSAGKVAGDVVEGIVDGFLRGRKR